MEKLNHYETLGIPPDASQKEIARAYHRLARRFHPDLQPPERKRWAEEQMKRLNEAYAVVRDPEARVRYDATVGLRFSAPPFKQGSASPSSGEWFTGSSAYKAPTRVRSNQWRDLTALADLVLWTLVVGFLVIGAYLVLVEWRYMFQSPMQEGRT